ncbi:MAG: DNA-directed RNA polymerase subunit alpha [Patescibacteria group bacterium]
MFTEHIQLPNKISYADGQKPNEKVLTIEPCFRGFGTTLGNALRRVLLSSLTGTAITEVKITGADHEFSSLDGVKEDVVDIILNLKAVRFKLHTDEPVELSLKVSGAKKVTAKDFDKNTDVEVINPDAPICSLSSKDASFEMTAVVQKGRGYESVDQRNEEKKEIGSIAIDAIYTPVVNVSMDVSQARVGQDINFDKVELGIETDGSITPEEAVEEASKVLVKHFNLFTGDVALEEEVVEEAEEEAAPAEETEESDK